LGCITTGVSSNGILVCEELAANNVERNVHGMVRGTTGGSEENNKVPVRTVGVAAQFTLHTSRIQARNITDLRSLLSENNIIILNCFQEADQEIPSPLWDPKFRYRVHKNWPLKRILCKMKPPRFLGHSPPLHPHGEQPLVGQGLLVIEASRS
jgi:hypothetical protein